MGWGRDFTNDEDKRQKNEGMKKGRDLQTGNFVAMPSFCTALIVL
jgi:hypothetical protein